MDRPLLILDLDETLVWSSDVEPATGECFRACGYYVTRRPHLDEFLARAAACYQLAVWSSGDDRYALELAARILPASAPPRFVWGRSRCVRRMDPETLEYYFLKDLQKLKRQRIDLRRVLTLDDSPEKHRRNYGNLLRVSPFEGSPDDHELRQVLPFLEWIAGQPDFRAIEKRGWRTFQRQLAARP